MRVIAVLLLFLVAGFGWALWQGIDLASARLAEVTAEEPALPGLDGVELTSPEGGSEPPEEAPQPASRGTGDVGSGSAQGRAADLSAEPPATPAVVSEEPASPSAGAVPETAPGTLDETAPGEAPEPSATIVAGAPVAPSAEPPPEPVASDAPSDTRRVTGDQVNLRQEPDVGSASLALLSLDDPVEVLEAQGSWLRVRTQDGQEGWVAARFAAEDPN
jgi:hypothetical protein